ncbi:NADH-quinone oxidoreductase subunit C [Streptomyces sp. NPDC026672]|uniref:NADH-quinone oxidoreductase subunit C n=1 Tax=unclassified Streptomyces TaxID=2593676 RepID=UPI0033F940E1
MTTVGWLPAPVEDLFGTEATAEESYEVLTVDVPPSAWIRALETARTTLSCTYFDWLSAVDEPGTGFRVAAHVVALSPVRRLLLRTTVPHEAPALPSAVGVYAGATWHERETHEMFGVDFHGHPGLDHLLLPETFEGHPLRKDFVLAARVAKAWPGAKEPGESDHGTPKRRQMLPPGVPDPNDWGPLKGQLPPAPARPARGAGRAAGERPARGAAAAGDRPARRTRTAAEGSTGQTAATTAPPKTEGTPPAQAQAQDQVQASAPTQDQAQASAPAGREPGATARRSRTAAEGSASQTATSSGPSAAPSGPGEPGTPARRTRSAAEGSASQGEAAGPRRARTAGEGSASQRAEEAPETPPQPTTPAGPRRARTASEGSASQRAQDEETPTAPEPAAPTTRSTAPRSADAPWHHARPAFDEAPEKPTGKPTEEPTEAETAPNSKAADSKAAEEKAPAPEAPAAEDAAPDAPVVPESDEPPTRDSSGGPQ